MNKKGQAALEFIMTYGWAIMVVMVMIGAISYFGIINPTKLLPERCTTTAEFNCIDHAVDSNGRVFINLKQAVGRTAFLHNMTCTYNDNVVDAISQTDGDVAVNNVALSWPPRNAKNVYCDIPMLSTMTGQKVKITFDIVYQKSNGGLYHPAEGEMFVEVQ